jgi:preprotein translocase subunit SecY
VKKSLGLIGTGRFNTLLVVVVDLDAGTIFGQLLLDLNKEYGVSSGGHPNIVG